MKFEIGKPEHGWVSIMLVHNETEILFESSDVPNNPISELITAIELTLSGRNASVWWHLEPAGYYFNFKTEGSELKFEILYSLNSNEPEAQSVLVVRGGLHELLIPFWRALRKFETYNHEELHWPSTDFSSLAELK